jgi:hypothetical protein
MKYKRRAHAESRRTSSGLCAGGIESELLGLTLQGGGIVPATFNGESCPLLAGGFKLVGKVLDRTRGSIMKRTTVPGCKCGEIVLHSII